MSGKTIAIHQPNYFPWIGYFHKMYVSDVFVFFDDVEYTSGSFINRNRIKTPDGWMWITVPTKTSSTEPIIDVKIDNQKDWRKEHWMSVQRNYANANHFDEFKDFIKELYDRDWEMLHRLNVHILKEIASRVGFEIEFVRSSELDVEGEKTHLLANICEELGGDVYFSGRGAKDYMEREIFENKGIELKIQDFEHPEYNQRFGDFVPNLSFLDALLNIGSKKSFEIIKNL